MPWYALISASRKHSNPDNNKINLIRFFLDVLSFPNARVNVDPCTYNLLFLLFDKTFYRNVRCMYTGKQIKAISSNFIVTEVVKKQARTALKVFCVYCWRQHVQVQTRRKNMFWNLQIDQLLRKSCSKTLWDDLLMFTTGTLQLIIFYLCQNFGFQTICSNL